VLAVVEIDTCHFGVGQLRICENCGVAECGMRELAGTEESACSCDGRVWVPKRKKL
jgi:hypothetical protein